MSTKTDQLLGRVRALLSVIPNQSARQICTALGITQPAFSRLITRHAMDFYILGAGPSTRYSLKKNVANLGVKIPIYDVGENGRVSELANLHAIEPNGFVLESNKTEMVFNDLPYFFEDIRPSGYLGRLVPKQLPTLQFPEDVRAWSSLQILEYAAHYGWNPAGNLIIGENACKQFIQNTQRFSDLIHIKQREKDYPERATLLLVESNTGSSAGGEQPKFLATLQPEMKAVLVKFSPVKSDVVSERVCDLLVCEHLAHEVIRRVGIEACKSEVVIAKNQYFLEVQRFDRVGERGRKGVVSLRALDLEHAGILRSWAETGAVLVDKKILQPGDLEKIRWLEFFGRFIGNTDMHLGNLSFYFDKLNVGSIAPVYDMLPMKYMPQSGHMQAAELKIELTLPDQVPAWTSASGAAIQFWESAIADPRISDDFKKIAKKNITVINAMIKIQANI